MKMEVGYGKKGSSAWPSRLSASAQPFTMNRHGGQPPALTSLTSSSSDKPFTPAPSNPLDEHDFLLHNSFSNLTLEDQLQSLIDDSALSAFSFDDSSDFGVDHLLPKYPLAPIQGYCDSLSLAHESLLQQGNSFQNFPRILLFLNYNRSYFVLCQCYVNILIVLMFCMEVLVIIVVRDKDKY